MSSHELHRDDAGAYLLGALEPGEAAAFEGHLAGCPECRAEVEQLRVATAALPRAAEPFSPPPSLKRSLMDAVHADAAADGAPARKQRRSLFERLGLGRVASGMRPELAWVSAAFVLAVGIALGAAVTLLSSGDEGDKRVISAEVDRSRVNQASATLTLPEDGDGPAHLRVTGLPKPEPGQVYEIWLKRGNQVQPGPLFAVNSQGEGVGAIPDDLDGVSAVLVTRERTGGALMPSEAPIISAKI
jgi:anti-sigma factor RsiW